MCGMATHSHEEPENTVFPAWILNLISRDGEVVIVGSISVGVCEVCNFYLKLIKEKCIYYSLPYDSAKEGDTEKQVGTSY